MLVSNVCTYHLRVREAVTANAAMPLVAGKDVGTPIGAFWIVFGIGHFNRSWSRLYRCWSDSDRGLTGGRLYGITKYCNGIFSTPASREHGIMTAGSGKRSERPGGGAIFLEVAHPGGAVAPQFCKLFPIPTAVWAKMQHHNFTGRGSANSPSVAFPRGSRGLRQRWTKTRVESPRFGARLPRI
jgi:hypothetical protein